MKKALSEKIVRATEEEINQAAAKIKTTAETINAAIQVVLEGDPTEENIKNAKTFQEARDYYSRLYPTRDNEYLRSLAMTKAIQLIATLEDVIWVCCKERGYSSDTSLLKKLEELMITPKDALRVCCHCVAQTEPVRMAYKLLRNSSLETLVELGEDPVVYKIIRKKLGEVL